jgi:broad specificity phosphatase PhoE
MPTPGAESSSVLRGPAAPDGRPNLWVCRHGETEWSRAGRHTGVTDLDLTPHGRDQARQAGDTLRHECFGLVLTSPLRRARATAELAGYPDAEVEPDAVEWDYGEYEGLTTDQVRTKAPGWTIWHGEVPGGETAAAVAARADRVVARVRSAGAQQALVFSHGHFLRVLAARWLALGPEWGERLKLETATVSQLGWEREAPAVVRWNARA